MQISSTKKCQSQILCLQNLRSLKVNEKVLQGFYKCFIESILTFSFICWFENLSLKSKNVLNRIVNVCGKVVGESQESLRELYERRVEKKAKMVANDENHVLFYLYMSFCHQVVISVCLYKKNRTHKEHVRSKFY